MNGAFCGLVQRFVVPNETNTRHDDATKLAQEKKRVSSVQVLAASIAEKAKEKEATAQRPAQPQPTAPEPTNKELTN